MATAVDLTAVLQNAQSADANARQQAEGQLQQFQLQNYAAYLVSLATELSKEQADASTRQIAGVILKNSFDAPSDARKAELAARWGEQVDPVKSQIRQLLLGTLGSEVQIARHTAALVIAKVAAIELPKGQWPDLIPTLLANMGAQPPKTGLKQSTLEAMGYICEELGNLDTDVLDQEQVNSILTAVVQGMRKEEPDVGVKHAATVALYNAIVFAQTNFENPEERNYLMQVICEGTIAADAKVREASFECLVKIAANYYEKLPAYMQDIFRLTHRAAKEDEEEVAKQAIEFWCTICEEEIDIQQEEEEGDSNVIHHHFVQQALQPLVDLLLLQLSKQEEGQDEDDGAWNLSMAGGTCLALVSAVVGDDILGLVMPYTNIDKKASPEDWRYREAATSAFGAILEGPSTERLSTYVAAGLGFLLNAMKDPNQQVRHTTAWAIGRIFEFVHSPAVVNEQSLPQIVGVLLASIRDSPLIAEKVCYALAQLAAGFKDSDQTSLLSPYFKDIVGALLDARQGEPQEVARLQAQAFEAINDAVRSASADTLPLVAQLIPLMLSKLGSTFQAPANSADERERQSELQGLLSGVLQVIIQKLSEQDVTKAGVTAFADTIMEALLSVFACHSSTVHEEAMLAVGALTYACGTQFNKYMERFYPYLELGLKNYQEWQVCQVTVGVLGDVCRAIEEQIAPYTENIMRILLRNLECSDVQRNIKPQILSAFGDMALAIGDRFEVCLPSCLHMLQSAQSLSVMQQQAGDEAAFEYNSLLRHGIFEAYSGILNGMSTPKCDQYIRPFAPAILEFGEYVYNDKENQDDAVTKSLVSLLGDLASNVTGCGPVFAQKPYVQSIIQEARASGEASTAEAADWALGVISKAVTAQQ
ncbi:ARM repeat-containing protein [Coccomyxa subellipsoidea C-169]|uniref:ARM repeat-containing protein n=1 Tax=Coccomyxa subellipsoidea (strain C-169) TaxID=574566 RepID=I0Z9G4_COCSC|nr:ARM repeat-containing protein [Coccomyxa subellipsoidea C-169]EIE27283.1 ARM repeat-containing protein [Coccomyxa subellipsoidea C-169]|eukprot:XP_005651827.1 ARM repeat-containing protein [Coccomyxa subellipsoidea C-169]